MGVPPPPTPTHLYPQALQLKLYQAFIFSIPILFSIILFLLFYLFYLKRRASTLSSSQQILPTRSSNQATPYFSSICQIGLKKELEDKLPTVLFDEELRSREPLCCVCLGEFEMKEELLQIPSCRHVFHTDCIRHWLLSNSTCPLCRSFVIPIIKLDNPEQSSVPVLLQQDNANFSQHPQNISSEQQQQRPSQGAGDGSRELMIPIEGSSIVRMESVSLSEMSILARNGRDSSNQ